MKSRNRVYVEIGADDKVVRIYRSHLQIPLHEPVVEVSRHKAVGDIREQVFERAAGHCERCGTPITTRNGHMHETIPRGRGGEISLENSVALCAKCHLGKTGVHADHYPQFGLRKEEDDK